MNVSVAPVIQMQRVKMKRVLSPAFLKKDSVVMVLHALTKMNVRLVSTTVMTTLLVLIFMDLLNVPVTTGSLVMAIISLTSMNVKLKIYVETTVSAKTLKDPSVEAVMMVSIELVAHVVTLMNARLVTTNCPSMQIVLTPMVHTAANGC